MDLEPQPPLPVTLTPSLLLNNLSSGCTGLTYVSQGKAVIRYGGKRQIEVKTGMKVKVYQSSFVMVAGRERLALALSSGFQIWTADGLQMLYFFSLERDRERDARYDYCRGIASSPAGEYVFVGCSNGDVYSFHAPAEAKIEYSQSLVRHRRPITCIAASSRFVVSADNVGCAIVWNAKQNFSQQCCISSRGYPITSVAVHRDLFVTGTANGTARIYSSESGHIMIEIGAHSRCINAISIHPNFPILATTGEDAVLNLWSLPDGDSCSGSLSSACDLLFSASLVNSLITGVCFLSDDLLGKTCVAIAAYEKKALHAWKECKGEVKQT